MLSTRWTALAAPDSAQTHCSVVAVQLTLRTAHAAAIVDTWADRIGDALPTPGLLGVMLERTPTRMCMVSAWSRRADMAAYERDSLHRDAKAALHEHVLPPTVAVWTELVAALPPHWHDVQQRLDVAHGRQHPDSASLSTPGTPSPPGSAHGSTTP